MYLIALIGLLASPANAGQVDGDTREAVLEVVMGVAVLPAGERRASLEASLADGDWTGEVKAALERAIGAAGSVSSLDDILEAALTTPDPPPQVWGSTVAPPPPPQPEPFTAADLAAARSYRAGLLTLESWQGHHGETRWGLQQSAAPYGVPDALLLAQRTDDATALTERIDRDETRSRRLRTVGRVGGAVAAGGLTWALLASDRDAYGSAGAVTAIGLTVAAFGYSGTMGYSRYADRLRGDYAAVMTPAEAQALADAHNEALRQELDVSPRAAWEAETSPGSDR